jgi:HEAT repeat protein
MMPAAPLLKESDFASLRAAAGDPDPRVRWASVQALHELKDREAERLLKAMLRHDPDAGLRARAASLLRDPSAALEDPDPEVRLEAVRSLQRREERRAAVRDVLRDELLREAREAARRQSMENGEDHGTGD